MTGKVTVGIPVFNGAETLLRAVKSALSQTRPVDLIHISDNASTDKTSEIGRMIATSYERVLYTRHPSNLGISGNFGFVLQQARTEYFMWLAADDYIEPTYVERMLAELQADPGLVACVSRALFLRSDGTTRMAEGTYPLLCDRISNLAAYLSNPADNSRSYGIYRTQVLQKSFPPRYFHAYDWAYVAGTLLHGRHMEVAETLLVREETPSAAYLARARSDHATALGRLFPLIAMTVDVLWRLRVPLRWPVIRALLRINLERHLDYVSVYHPRYNKTIGSLLRHHVVWRLSPARPSCGNRFDPNVY
jgi:glycosyltransferase involved in cell wall biosynthesis